VAFLAVQVGVAESCADIYEEEAHKYARPVRRSSSAGGADAQSMARAITD
jgi:hypothetical protein